MTKPVVRTKDVDCREAGGECGAVVTLTRNPKTQNYNGECPGCGKKLQTT